MSEEVYTTSEIMVVVMDAILVAVGSPVICVLVLAFATKAVYDVKQLAFMRKNAPVITAISLPFIYFFLQMTIAGLEQYNAEYTPEKQKFARAHHFILYVFGKAMFGMYALICTFIFWFVGVFGPGVFKKQSSTEIKKQEN